MNILLNRLNTLISSFSVPADKRGDLVWLSKNISIGNSGHRDLSEVQSIITQLLNQKYKDRVKNGLKNS